MILGSLIDAGLKLSILKKELSKLNIGDFRLKAEKVKRLNFWGIKFDVHCSKKKRYTKIEEVFSLIRKSSLDPDIKRTSVSLFKRLEEKEKAVHGGEKEGLSLDQLGEVDSIIDIVGSAIAFKELGIEKIFVSKLISGTKIGPATLELLKGRDIEYINEPFELVTPTGALIAASFAEKEELPPPFRIERTGYGAGKWNLKSQPNLLRAIIGETNPKHILGNGAEQDSVYVLETNIDDSSPMVFERLFERLYKIGCLEAYITPVQMKKSRPGIVLTTLAGKEIIDEAAKIIFEETTTFGIRMHKVDRFKLRRKTKIVKTKFGNIRANIGYLGKEIMSVTPEYEDCRKLAIKNKVPLKQILKEI